MDYIITRRFVGGQRMIAIQDFIQQTLLSLSLVISGVSLYGVTLDFPRYYPNTRQVKCILLGFHRY